MSNKTSRGNKPCVGKPKLKDLDEHARAYLIKMLEKDMGAGYKRELARLEALERSEEEEVRFQEMEMKRMEEGVGELEMRDREEEEEKIQELEMRKVEEGVGELKMDDREGNVDEWHGGEDVCGRDAIYSGGGVLMLSTRTSMVVRSSPFLLLVTIFVRIEN